SSLRILRSIESRRAGTDAPLAGRKLTTFIPRNIISRKNIARSCDRDRRFAAGCGCGGCRSWHISAESHKSSRAKEPKCSAAQGNKRPKRRPSRGAYNMAKTTHAKVVIIGSGPAGYTAAIYAARAMLEPILIQGVQPGGQLTITTDVENYPGFADVIQGPWLMEQMEKQATHVGTSIVTDHVTSVDLGRRPFRVECDSGDVYLADSRIIATGAQARWLDLPSEQKFKGYGVSACATC